MTWNPLATIAAVTDAPTGTQAVDRAARLLTEIVDRAEPVTFSELAASSGLAKSTTSRLLLALERNGLVARDEAGAYRAGELFARYGSRTGGLADLAIVARPHLERLGELTGETVNLGVEQSGGVQQIAQVDSPYVLGAANWVGRLVPLHCTALGKVLLAHGAAQLPPGRLERLTERTITSRSALDAELEEVRRRGWAVTDEELEPGLVAVAAPVSDDRGVVVAALSVTGPTARVTPGRVRELVAHCIDQAHALSETLGHRSRREGAA
ncbi:helix-turn-helix domain-containing protein [Acidimicrobiaceae bacterium USS-CC1]|uniref:Helix-turn-helix domain-containing protein n=1 Tax=Acidiferrimicrobium australe TaxID=2664430 RepID=A0ABW9QV85_9ACTN|nr:helix-turn-helix domain-containing protein [Acidiferrimicrobium australe]